ncbi:unnamed protein product [Moneuplotes crassus]|uniref:Uncharacterized protein n=1 Tax=Euplotes crassus TaxID=5936 RepID=A0AAD2D5J1_EUPCR|nr:unnamed protein product [Moneuplotes crassus]
MTKLTNILHKIDKNQTRIRKTRYSSFIKEDPSSISERDSNKNSHTIFNEKSCLKESSTELRNSLDLQVRTSAELFHQISQRNNLSVDRPRKFSLRGKRSGFSFTPNFATTSHSFVNKSLFRKQVFKNKSEISIRNIDNKVHSLFSLNAPLYHKRNQSQLENLRRPLLKASSTNWSRKRYESHKFSKIKISGINEDKSKHFKSRVGGYQSNASKLGTAWGSQRYFKSSSPPSCGPILNLSSTLIFPQEENKIDFINVPVNEEEIVMSLLDYQNVKSGVTTQKGANGKLSSLGFKEILQKVGIPANVKKMKGLRSTIKSDIDLKKIVKGLNTNKVLKKAQTIKKVGKIQFRNSVKLDHAFLDYQQKPQNIFELASDKSIKVDSKSKKEDDDIFKSETFYFLNNLPLFKELSCTKDQSLYLKDSFISTGKRLS